MVMRAWVPDLRNPEPGYREIAGALALAIQRGDLRAGDRLPTHRELAARLGVALATVSRAYAEAARHGLIAAEVGRGTFVREPYYRAPTPADERRAGAIDLGLLAAPRLLPELAETLRVTAADVAHEVDLSAALEYQDPGGSAAHREAAARWISKTGLAATASRVVLCASAQHALTVTVSALCRPGDGVMVEALSAPGVRDFASWYPLRVHGLPMDHEGIIPETFEEACEMELARVLICTPTLNNPTTATMSESRRGAIAEIARRHQVTIIEDGVHGLLPRHAPRPLSAYAPDISFYLTSLSKTVSSGIRLGMVLAPQRSMAALHAAIRATVRMISPFLAELATRWINDGSADRMLTACREEADARQAVAREALRGLRFQSGPQSFHLWLLLPPDWGATEFARTARSKGVLVTPAVAFCAGRDPLVEGIRISLTAARDRQELRAGLGIIARQLPRIIR